VWTLTSSGRPRSRKRWNLPTSFRFFWSVFSRTFRTRSAAGLRLYLLSRDSIFCSFSFLLTAREACLNADGNMGITSRDVTSYECYLQLFGWTVSITYNIVRWRYKYTNTRWIKISRMSAVHHFRGEPWGDFGCSNRFCSRSSSLVRLLANFNVLQEVTYYDDLLEISLFIINSLSCYPTVSCL